MDYSSEQYHQYYQQYYNLNQQQQVAATSSSDQSTQAPQYAYSGYFDYSNNSYHQHEPTSIHPPGVPIQPDPTPSIDPQLQIQQAMYYPPPPPGLVVDTHSHYQFNPVQSAANTQIAQFTYSTDGGQIDGKPFQTGLHYGYHVPGAFHQHGAAHSVLPNSTRQTPFWPPPRLAWCELCRVDCNTQEILEQHKKGKRHTKILQIHEELKSMNRIIGQQNLPKPKPEVFPSQQETLPSAAVTDGNKIATEQPKDSGQVARGAKFVKTNKGSRKLAAGPLKQKEAIPFVCEMCNSKCESQVVFDSHLAGKKHRANLEKFHRDRAMFGEPGLKAPYQHNVNTSLSSANQVPPATKTVSEITTPNLLGVVSDIQQESVSTELQVTPGVIGTSLPEPNDANLPQQSFQAPPAQGSFQAPPAQGRDMKRKMSGVRGSMRMRTNKGSRKPGQPSKPKEVIPFVCEMCNAKCETQLVFNSHLAGKKHKLNIAKFHSNEAVHGESGPSLNALLSSSNQAQNEKVVHDPPLPTHALTQTEELASASELAQAVE